MCSAHSRPCIDLFGGFLGVIPGHRTEELRRERAANQHKTKQKKQLQREDGTFGAEVIQFFTSKTGENGGHFTSTKTVGSLFFWRTSHHPPPPGVGHSRIQGIDQKHEEKKTSPT